MRVERSKITCFEFLAFKVLERKKNPGHNTKSFPCSSNVAWSSLIIFSSSVVKILYVALS